MIELMHLKITSQPQGAQGGRNRASSDYDNKTDDEDGAKAKEKEEILSPKEKQMAEVLNQKRQEVVLSLIDNLNSKGNTDLEVCLNAHLILTELTETDYTFAKLLEKENFVRLMQVACDAQNSFQGYALSVLSSIITEYPDFEKSVPQDVSKEFQQTVTQSFNDLTYSCLLVIRASDDSLGLEPATETRNQAGETFNRFGMRRMRALELVRQELSSISKFTSLQGIQQMSSILRRHIISTMLEVISNYKYCSAACHEAIEVLDILKIAFDDVDIETLKTFVKENLSSKNQTHLKFQSGNRTTNANLASIIKIGIALKRITISSSQSNQDSSSDDEEIGRAVPAAPAKSFKHLTDPEWTSFVDNKLNKFETKWTKKLETYTEEDHQSASADDVEVVIQNSDSDDDITLGSTAHSKVDSMFDQDLDGGGDEAVQHSREYLANQYWKVPEQFDLDDLLKDAEL